MLDIRLQAHPNNKNIDQFLELVGEPIYEGLGRNVPARSF